MTAKIYVQGTTDELQEARVLFGPGMMALTRIYAEGLKPPAVVARFDRPFKFPEDEYWDLALRRGAVPMLIGSTTAWHASDWPNVDPKKAPFIALPADLPAIVGVDQSDRADKAATAALWYAIRNRPAHPYLVAKVIGRTRLTATGDTYEAIDVDPVI